MSDLGIKAVADTLIERSITSGDAVSWPRIRALVSELRERSNASGGNFLPDGAGFQVTGYDEEGNHWTVFLH